MKNSWKPHFSPLRRRTRQYSLRYSRGVLLYPLSSLRRCSSRGVVSLKFSERGTLLLVRAICISSLPLAPKSRFVSSASPRELLSLSLSLIVVPVSHGRRLEKERKYYLCAFVLSLIRPVPRCRWSAHLTTTTRAEKGSMCRGVRFFFFSVVYFSVENGGHKLTLTAGL